MNSTTQTALYNGKYVLNTQLGRGVFDVTYRATNTQLGQPVAIKTLSEQLCQHPKFEQFKRELLATATRLSHCSHPHLVRVLDCFEEAERPYIVMEYIQGQTLAELIEAQVLPEAQAVNYIRQIGKAMGVLHQANLLHRDIKPDHIIRYHNSDRVILCEFGFACDLTPGTTQTHAHLLSTGYAAPEQYSCQDHRTTATDIYALSATLYCLLTGTPPLPAPLRQLRYSNPNVSLLQSDLHPSIHHLSPRVKQAIRWGLAINPDKRPQTVEAWLSQLSNLQTSTTDNTEPVPSQPHPTNLNIKPKSSKIRGLVRALFVTGALAASAGVGFGIALRINRPSEPGSSILHTEQSFPPSSKWPVTEPRL